MKKARTILTLLGATLGLSAFPAAAQAAGNIQVLGLDDHDKAVHYSVPKGKYSEYLRQMIDTVQESAIPTLEKRGTNGRWMLRVVLVGLGIDGTVGLGPIISLKVAPRFRFGFTNQIDPIVP